MNGFLIITALILVGLAAGGVLAFIAWAWQILFRKDEWIEDGLIHSSDFDRDLEGWTERQIYFHVPGDVKPPPPEAIAKMLEREQNRQKWFEENGKEVEAELRKMQKEVFK